MIWRWDQGRSEYFKFESILKIAPVLLKYNGADMKQVDSQFRTEIMAATSLPFAPSTYTIKRNYKRVFECMMLCSYIGNRLFLSDIGRNIATPNSTLSNVDSYLFEVETRFRYPYPSFDNYNDVKTVCFPFMAMLKLLFARAISTNNPYAKISLDDVGCYLIANEVKGTESLEFYQSLKPKEGFDFQSYGSNDQKRQVREMMHFLGEHTFLSNPKKDDLQISGIKIEDCLQAFSLLKAQSIVITSKTPIDDFRQLTSYRPIPGEFEFQYDLENFSTVEGKKVFKGHFTYERSPKLRKEYIKVNPCPICSVCGRDMHIVYPWTENMLEVHHVCPLSSHDGSEGHETKMEDVVGACPSCHRAIHLYYKQYLIKNKQSDFMSKDEAKTVYLEAKEIVQNNG